MPSVIHAPEVGEEKAQSLQEAQPQERGARTGFWPMVMQSMRRYSTSQAAADVICRPECAAPAGVAHGAIGAGASHALLLGFCGMHNS